jgi:hypothetical protein
MFEKGQIEPQVQLRGGVGVAAVSAWQTPKPLFSRTRFSEAGVVKSTLKDFSNTLLAFAFAGFELLTMYFCF